MERECVGGKEAGSIGGSVMTRLVKMTVLSHSTL